MNILLFVLGVLLCWPAMAQQVPHPTNGPNSVTVGSLAVFDKNTGNSLNQSTPSISGFYYGPHIGQGLLSSVASQDPSALLSLSKTYDTGGLAPGSPIARPTLYSVCKLAAVGTDDANKSCRGVMGEALDLVGGNGTFVEGGKFVGVVPASVPLGNGAYGVIAWGQAYDASFTIGIEAQTIRTNGGDAPGPRAFDINHFVANFLASNTFSGVGNRGDVAFMTNPYSTPGKWSAAFVCSNNTVESTSGVCFMDKGGSAIGLDLSAGGNTVPQHTLAAILMSNTDGIRWWDAAGTTIHTGIYFASDNSLRLSEAGVSTRVNGALNVAGIAAFDTDVNVLGIGNLGVGGNIASNGNISVTGGGAFAAGNYVVTSHVGPVVVANTWTIWMDSATGQLKASLGSSPFTVKVLAP